MQQKVSTERGEERPNITSSFQNYKIGAYFRVNRKRGAIIRGEPKEKRAL